MRRSGCIGRFAEILEADDELVTAPTAREVADAQISAQAVSDLSQQLVADIVAESVVDRLEAIEVNKQDGKGPFVALAAPHRPA